MRVTTGKIAYSIIFILIRILAENVSKRIFIFHLNCHFGTVFQQAECSIFSKTAINLYQFVALIIDPLSSKPELKKTRKPEKTVLKRKMTLR